MFAYVNVDSPLHWGQKYEPLSVLIYESMYNTTVDDFGCIQHDKYKFLGALSRQPLMSRYAFANDCFFPSKYISESKVF